MGHKPSFTQCKKLMFDFFLLDQILTFDPWPQLGLDLLIFCHFSGIVWMLFSTYIKYQRFLK